MLSNKQIGILSVLVGNVLFSAKAIFAKLIYQYDVDATTLMTLRLTFSAPFFIAAALLARRKSQQTMTKKDWTQFSIFAFLGYYGASFLNFLGLQYVSAGLERLILFCYPTLVVLLSTLFLNAKISRTQVYALLLTYAGIAVVVVPHLSTEPAHFWLGAALIFGSALSFAIYLVRVGKYIQRFGSVYFISHVMILATAMTVIHFLLARDFSVLQLPLKVYLLFFGLAIFSTVIPVFLITKGIEKLGASNVSIIASVGPVATIVLANVFLDEPILGIQLLGTALVLAGVWLVSKKAEALPEKEAMEQRVR